MIDLLLVLVRMLSPSGVLALFLPKNLDVGEIARSTLPELFHVEVEANYQRCLKKPGGRVIVSEYTFEES